MQPKIRIATLGYMMIAGCTTDGLKQWVTPTGERIALYTGRAQKTYLGVGIQEFSAKRIWVDEVLSDFERCAFLKTVFSDQPFYSIDYEIIERDSGRELLHAFALHQPVSCKKVAAIETNLHGLGRALSILFKPVCIFQCMSIYDDYVLLSVHRNDCLYYFIQEFFSSTCRVVYAMRVAIEHYYAAHPIEVERCFYVNFSSQKKLDSDQSDCFDAPLTCIDVAWRDWLIPYGLACRGVQRD